MSIKNKQHNKIDIQIGEVLLWVLFYNVAWIGQVPWLDKTSNILRAVISFLIILKYCFGSRILRINKMVIIVTLLATLALLTTYLNDDTLMGAIIRYAPIVSMMMHICDKKMKLSQFCIPYL